MRNERSLTPQETARLDKRAKLLYESFMWKKESTSKRARRAMPICIGAMVTWCIFIVGAAAVGAAVGVLPSMREMSFEICLSIAAGAIIAISIMTVMFVMSERSACKPPVFIFYDDKLFYVDSDEDFSMSDIPWIPAGEMMALRESAQAATSNKASQEIEAQLFYLGTIEKHLRGGNESEADSADNTNSENNVGERIFIAVIEDIVDVNKDADGETFTISYENGQGHVVDARCPMSDWKNLYDWLAYQMGEDD